MGRFAELGCLAAAALPLVQSQRNGSGWHGPGRHGPGYGYGGSQADFCNLLAQTFQGKVSFAGQPAYNNSQTNYWVANERQLQPGCVFVPTSSNDVSQFVQVVNAVNSRGSRGPWGWSNNAQPPQFAVRSGGHIFIDGAANINGGVTVDMRAMNSVALNSDKTVGLIGGGAVFSDVYPQLNPHKRIVMGGRIPGIAAGGFVSGGGKTFSSRAYGWSCDNVVGYEIVLASGEIAYASADSYPDLWWALQGGQNNFGIITRFDMKAFEQGDMLGGVFLWNYTDATKAYLAATFQGYMDPANYDGLTDAGIVMGWRGQFIAETEIWSLEPKEVKDLPVFSNFTGADGVQPVQAPTLIGPVSAQVQKFGTGLLPAVVGYTHQYVMAFRNPDAATYLAMMNEWEAEVNTITDVKGLMVQWYLQPQPVRHGQGPNNMGLMPEQRDVSMLALGFVYDDENDTDRIYAVLDSLYAKYKSRLQGQGLWENFVYLNYADARQEVFQTWGEDRVQFLQDVSRKYDPRGMFQINQPGGFKIFPKSQ